MNSERLSDALEVAQKRIDDLEALGNELALGAQRMLNGLDELGLGGEEFEDVMRSAIRQTQNALTKWRMEN